MMSSQPDVCQHALEHTKDAWLIVACDGVWDVLLDQQACDIVLQHTTAKSAAEVCAPVARVHASFNAYPMPSVSHCHVRCRLCASKRTAVVALITSLAALSSSHTQASCSRWELNRLPG